MKSIFTAVLLCLSLSFAIAKEPPIRVTEIINSGDGKTAKTAYEVYSIDEEYQLLEHLKLNPKMQILSIIDGQYFDILQVGEKKIYFKLISKPKAQII
ncbi:MAG: DUF4919 domain-containing protein [Saprospiraceae bacterium]|nr:DUF4919 domain-containing protein [Saprospiraceae bacterium]